MVQIGVRPCVDSFEHLADELHTLDLRIARCVARMQQTAPQVESLSSYRFISQVEVELLLRDDYDAARDQNDSDAEMEAWQAHVGERVAAALSQHIYLALPHLAQIFGLTWFELQAVVICLAPELRPKYDKLYAYLHDDITRKKPSVDLVLQLL